jgi:two-component system sensor histidine kinase UhpB
MNLSWLSKRIGVQSELVSEKLVQIEHMIRNSISTVQKISSELRPAILYDLGLREAVEWHMQQNLEPSGIKGSFRMVPADLKIDEKCSIVLFRIIQEGLTNIVRHSGADRADIRIAGSTSFIELIIKDNGKGIDAAAVNDSRSFGITSIKERVNGFSGDFDISGKPGRGTTLKVKIPLTINAISR